jgi:hypothetical protein
LIRVSLPEQRENIVGANVRGAASRKPPIAGVAEQISMPISQFLGNSKFDPETKRIMGLAFEMTRLALGLADRGDIANELIAKRIIELAKAGERNPDLLCESAVKEFRERLGTDREMPPRPPSRLGGGDETAWLG